MRDPALTMTVPAETVSAIAELAAQLVLDKLSDSARPAWSPYMSVTEAADYLRCRPQRIYDLLSARRLTRHKEGSRVLVARSELETHLRTPQ